MHRLPLPAPVLPTLQVLSGHLLWPAPSLAGRWARLVSQQVQPLHTPLSTARRAAPYPCWSSSPATLSALTSTIVSAGTVPRATSSLMLSLNARVLFSISQGFCPPAVSSPASTRQTLYLGFYCHMLTCASSSLCLSSMFPSASALCTCLV